MIYSISTDIFGIFALLFTIYLARRNIVIDNYRTKIYLFASVVTIVLLILEIISVLWEISNIGKLILLDIIVNVIGFALSPLVPFAFLLFYKKKIDYFIIVLAIPMLINIIISILSYKTGWLFFFNDQNEYMRGNYFFITIIICLFYYTLLIICTIKNCFEYDNYDKKFLAFLFLVPMLSTILQILFEGLLIIWASVSLTLLLYYIFIRELQFKYDTITGIKSRATFDKEIERYQKYYDNIAIVMFDLNDFKKINDNLGHKSGDNAICNAAKILKLSFMDIGESYRIGGDEFCVICNNVTKKTVNSSLEKLEQLANEINKKNDIKIVFAYGYAIYIKGKNQSIYDVFMQADKAMYEHKAKLKGLYGRRRDDNI